MNKLWITLSFLIRGLLLSGCSTTLNPDPSPAAADAGYPTAEFRAGGQVFHGLGEVLIQKGAPLDEVGLQVQGYHEGLIRVDSGTCGLGQSWSYVDSELKPVPIPGLAQDSCLVDIVVAPSFGEAAGGNRVYELKGQLQIKVLDEGLRWYGTSTKVRVGGDWRLQIPVPWADPSAPVRVLFRGCESVYDRELLPSYGVVTLQATDLAGPIRKRHCLFEGAASQPTAPTERVSWRVWGYDPEFSPLPLPVIERCRRSDICVTADPTVSLLALDDRYVFNDNASFRFDPFQPHILRGFTVKGRSFVCLYEKQVWQCLN